MNFLHEQLLLINSQFHWLRPAWLFALIPLFIISAFLWRAKRNTQQWQQMIAPELLPFLLDQKTIRATRSLLWVLMLVWCLTVVALAGPSWIKRPAPVEKNQSALVILLDLSISMISEDVKPSRLARARLKIADILRERKDGQTALVVYAGEAHTVTPLSDDSATILSLLPTLDPSIMPLSGSNTEDAVTRGIELLVDAGAPEGDLLLITDGVVPAAFSKIHRLLSPTKYHLKILGVGTDQAAPIPSGNGGFLRDTKGAIVTAALNTSELTELAESVGGRYKTLANNDSDIHYLLPDEQTKGKKKQTVERDLDQWFDQGHWLVFLILPMVLLCFRRGFILMLLCAPLLFGSPESAYAFDLSSAWKTNDQQAAEKLKKGDAKAAAETFDNQEWKAAAEYRAGNYAAAAETYAQTNTAAGHYNRGNALAKQGKLSDAIKAYDEALTREPEFEDAKRNRALVDKLLKQQQANQQSSHQNQQGQNSQDQQKKAQEKNQQDQSSQNQQQNQEQQQQSQNQSAQNNGSEKNQSNQQGSQQSSNDNTESQQAQQNASGQSSSQQNNAQHAQASSLSSGESQQSSQSASSVAANAAAQESSQSSQASEQQAAEPLDESNLTPEQKQAIEQWLRRVPDDPGGLLRNKFKWQYLQNRQKKIDGEFESPENKADQRW